jgi:hypothetical protein
MRVTNKHQHTLGAALLFNSMVSIEKQDLNNHDQQSFLYIYTFLFTEMLR